MRFYIFPIILVLFLSGLVGMAIYADMTACEDKVVIDDPKTECLHQCAMSPAVAVESYDARKANMLRCALTCPGTHTENVCGAKRHEKVF